VSDVEVLLRRHAPVLLADSADRFLEGVEVHACASGRWLQYWVRWPGDRDHAGDDWELAMVRVDDLYQPVEAAYAAHRGAARRPWARVPREGCRPVVYAERDKHAARFRRGWHRHGWRVSRADGRVRLDAPVVLGVPAGVAGRLARRDPDAWLRGVCG
jgi:hypothetical protein